MSIKRPTDDAIARGYEPTDVNLRRLGMLAGGFVMFSILLGIVVWGFYRHLETKPLADDEPRSVLSSSKVARGGVPQQPQAGHEMSDAQDLRAMRAQEDAAFDAMGWQWDAPHKTHVVPSTVVDTVRARSITRPTATRPALEGGH